MIYCFIFSHLTGGNSTKTTVRRAPVVLQRPIIIWSVEAIVGARLSPPLFKKHISLFTDAAPVRLFGSDWPLRDVFLLCGQLSWVFETPFPSPSPYWFPRKIEKNSSIDLFSCWLWNTSLKDCNVFKISKRSLKNSAHRSLKDLKGITSGKFSRNCQVCQHFFWNFGLGGWVAQVGDETSDGGWWWMWPPVDAAAASH